LRGAVARALAMAFRVRDVRYFAHDNATRTDDSICLPRAETRRLQTVKQLETDELEGSAL